VKLVLEEHFQHEKTFEINVCKLNIFYVRNSSIYTNIKTIKTVQGCLSVLQKSAALNSFNCFDICIN